MSPFRKILVAVDFGPSSERALDLAMKLVEGDPEARLTVVHVCDIPPLTYAGATFTLADVVTSVIDAAEHQLEDKMRVVRLRVPNARAAIRQGAAWEEIVDVAKAAKVDAIVVGTHGRRGVVHALLGSVAEKVVRLAPMPVITVRGE